MSKSKELPNRRVLCYADRYRIVDCSDCKFHEYIMPGGMIYYCSKHDCTETWNEALRCKDFEMIVEQKPASHPKGDLGQGCIE